MLLKFLFGANLLLLMAIVSLPGSSGSILPQKAAGVPESKQTESLLKYPLASNLSSSSRGYYSSDEDHYQDHSLSHQSSSHYPSQHHGGRGGFNPLVVIAIAIFGLLTFVLLLQLLGVSIARSLSSSSTPLGSIPLDWLNLPDLMVKVADWIDGDDLLASNDSERHKRSIQERPNLQDWMVAYKRDKNNYSCVRKLACEVLANSTLAQKSVKSPLGGTILSMMGRIVNKGAEVAELVTQVVGDPDQCYYYATSELCD